MKRLLLLLVALCCLAGCCDTSAPAMPDLIPRPSSLRPGSGCFRLPATLGFSCADSTWLPAAEFLQRSLPDGVAVESVCGEKAPFTVVRAEGLDTIGGYRLSVTRRGIRLEAGSYGGVIAGIATLRQLTGSDGTVPAVEIEDASRFAWRGFMLDVARHFFTKEEVMALLDRMAQYKFNKFHWHLTDDQGWRIEIKRYPALTEQGAWRDPSTHNHDIRCGELAEEWRDASYLLPEKNLRRDADGRLLYGGYYTQEDIREVVAYAASLGIDVIPEVDMPGHSLRAVACYPGLSCTGRAEWGEAFSTPLCLGNDATLDFCKGVYEELFELFPYAYVHLGADEVEKRNWDRCPKCQRRIAREGLADEKELQSWFVREMERFFNEHGRCLVGWDEITDGGLSPTAVVQWWRSWLPQTLDESVANGNSVVLSPVEFAYLSEQNSRSLAKVYGYEPLAGLADEAAGQVLGVHTNLWTEFVPSFERACFHIFPRFFALSEIAWCGGGAEFEPFRRRVNSHLKRFDEEGWNFRVPDLDGFCDRNEFVDSVRVELRMPFEGLTVRYTTDGSVPDSASMRYEGPFTLHGECTLRLRAFTAAGNAGEVVTARYVRHPLREAEEVAGPLADGLTAVWYDYRGRSCAEIDAAPLKGRYVVEEVRIPDGVSGNIGLLFEGWLDIPEDGIYSFYTYSDDGSVVRVDGDVVVDNDGAHSRVERSGQAALSKGLHRLEIRYFDSNGGILEAGLIDSAGVRRPFAEGMLKHRRDA